MTCQLILTLVVGPQYEDLDIGMNPFTSNISLVILFTACCTILTILIWRIWYWIN